MLKKMLQKATGIMLVLSALFVSLGAYAQNRTISGKVVDANGDPVIGAAVTVAGNSRIGAATDLNGAFSLSVPAVFLFCEEMSPAILPFSFPIVS
jgi:hypothetical protein